MADVKEAYEESISIELDGWERRQLVMWVEDALRRTHDESVQLHDIAGRRIPQFEVDRQKEWLLTLLTKLQVST